MSLIGLLIFCSFQVCAQTAPDFTVTTTHNETVELYADYLDQGQTVLLEIMFTTCPPCNSIAPEMEPFYQSWGGGAGDVEFFSLSNKNFDSNADVHDYEEQYGITFPGVGEDGGSLEAVAPYQSGQFGPFFGTPTYIVIAPDGTVQFDVGSGNNQQMIEDLDAAIESTGAERPGNGGGEQTPDTVDYTVRVFKADQTTPLQGVEVQLVDQITSEVFESGITSGNGSHTFQDIVVDSNSIYAVRAQLDGPPLEGISTYDIVLIQRILLGLDAPDNVFQERCIDANGDGNNSPLDILDVRKLILGIYQEFTGGSPWIMIGLDASDQILELPVAFPDYGETNSTEVDLYGIKRGDLSGDVNPF